MKKSLLQSSLNDNSTEWFICSLDSLVKSILNQSTTLILNKTVLNNKDSFDILNHLPIQKTIYTNSNHFYQYYWLFLLIIELLVFIGNICLIILIFTNKSLYTNNTTRIVLSLAITDLFLSIFVMPFTLYSQVSYNNWNLGYGLCVVWLSSDVQLTTTSIFHLCCISYERYLSIAKPIIFRTNMKKRIGNLIITNWLLSFFLVTLPFIILSIFSLDVYHLNNDYLPKTYSCILASSSFIAYTTLITFWLPLIFMFACGLKTMFLIRNLDRSHASFNLNGSESIIKRRRDGLILSSNSTEFSSLKNSNMNKSTLKKSNSHTSTSRDNPCESDGVSLENLNHQNSNTAKNDYADNENDSNKLVNKRATIKFELENENTKESNESVQYERTQSDKSFNQSKKKSIKILSAKRTVSLALDRSNMLSRTVRKSVFKNLISARKELQAQKTLTIVLILFVLSYFPLFTHITSMSFSEVINKNSDFIFDNYTSPSNSTLIEDNIKFKHYICLTIDKQQSLKNKSAYTLYNVFEQQIVRETKNDIIFYSFTWLAYSSAIINPVLHLLLNNNFKKALISCFKKS